jgi:RHS repeat-associated protein
MTRHRETITTAPSRATVLGTGINAAVRRIALEYTDCGKLSKVSSHNNATVGSGTIVNQVALSYNAFNQLIEDAQSHSGAVAGGTPKVSYSYAEGTANQTRRLTPTYPSDKVITMSYGTANTADDRLSRLAGVSLTGDPDPLGEFAWMGAGRLVSLTMPQPGIALSYKHATGAPVGDSGDHYSGYDRFGRTVDMRWIKTSDQSSLSRIQYGYDRMNRRLWRQDLAAPADTKQDRFYSYDGLGQVKDSALGNLNINRTAIGGIPAQREAFDYDSIGNWKQYLRQANGDTTLDQKHTSNQDNQLTELDSNASGLSYDAAGNMTACRPDKDGDWSKGYTIVWDAWNRIVQVKNAQTSATVATYAYDGLTRRTTSTVSGTVRHFYYNNLWKCVEERLNASSNPDRVYFWSTRKGHRDELLRRDRATSGGALNETLWCMMDYFDPIAVADGSGTIQERYTYTAFGLASILTPTFTARTATSFAWNLLFHGQFRDPETGWDNYGFRYYIPWLGKWPSRDPIGEKGGRNIYWTVGNRTINRIDILGLLDLGTPSGKGKPGSNCASFATCDPNDNGFNPHYTDPNKPPSGFEDCRIVQGAGDCKEEKPKEKHVIIYIDTNAGFTRPPGNKGVYPNRFHVMSEDIDNPGTYEHQAGGVNPDGQGGEQFNGVTDPDKVTEDYLDDLDGPDNKPNVQKQDLCCPCKQKGD